MNWNQCKIIFLLMLLESGQAGDRPPLRNGLKGKHLRATAGHFPPVSVVVRNSSGQVIRYSGLYYWQFVWLSQRLNFTYDLFPAPENSPGFLVNGTWRGMIGQLARGVPFQEMDVSLGPFALSIERYPVINFAGLSSGTGSTLLVKYPTTTFSPYAVLKPFGLSIWMGWLASLTVAVVLGTFLVFLRTKIHDVPVKRGSYGDLILFIIGTIVAQGNYYRAKFKSILLLMATWCFAAFVFVNVYSSTLTSFLSATYKAPEINSMEQLAAKPDFQILTQIGTFPEIDLMNSRLSYFKVLNERLLKCPSCRFQDMEAIKGKVLEGNSAGFLPTSIASAYVESDFSKTKECRLTLANVQYSYQHMFFAVPKSSHYTEEFNREALWAIALGLNAKWRSDSSPSRSRCNLKYNSKGVAVGRSSFSIRLQQLYAAFVILLAGCVLATLQFIREVLHAKIRRSVSLHGTRCGGERTIET